MVMYKHFWHYFASAEGHLLILTLVFSWNYLGHINLQLQGRKIVRKEQKIWHRKS